MPVNLDTAAGGAGKSIGGVVTVVTTTTYQGFSARDFRIEGAVSNGKALTVLGRVFLTADNRLFQVLYLKRGDSKGADAAFSRLASSLVVGDPVPAKSPG